MRRFSAILLLSLCLCCWITTRVSFARDKEEDHPLTLTSEWLNDHELLLEWNNPGYPVVLERKFPDDPYFAGVAEFNRDDHFIDGDRQVNTTYVYRLRPKKTWYLDEYGPPHLTRFDLPAPAPPLVTRSGIDQVLVTAPQDSLQWEGELMVQMRIAGIFEEVGRIRVTASDTTVQVDHLETFKQQLFRLLYISDYNVSPPSVADTVFLVFPPPTRLYVKPLSDHSAQLGWSPPTEWPHAYQVLKQVGLDSTFFDVAFGDTFWVDEEVDFDRTTFYRVRGIMHEDIGDYSDVISTRLRMNTIKDLQVDKVEDLVAQLTWTEPAPISTHYFVQRSINGSDFATIVELPADARSYTDYLPRRGLNVSYRIISANSFGNEAVSDAVSQSVRTVAYGMMLMQNSPDGRQWFVDADEVSAAEFQRFCQETGRPLPQEPEFASGGFWTQRNNLPAVMVTWSDAVAFCNWRSLSLGLEPAYDDSGNVVNEAGGFRLPTRAIYTAAVRELADGLKEATANANLLGPQDGFTWLAPGLGLVINPTTMVHIIGNVAEWVQDDIPPDGRLTLGGSFATPPDLIEDEVPEAAFPGNWRASTIGFRCILPGTIVADAP